MNEFNVALYKGTVFRKHTESSLKFSRCYLGKVKQQQVCKRISERLKGAVLKLGEVSRTEMILPLTRQLVFHFISSVEGLYKIEIVQVCLEKD